MKRCYQVYRGDQLLGYVGLDDQSPCEPFEPADGFREVEALFAKEKEVATLACELDRTGQREQADAMFLEADKLQDQILAPGVRFEALEAMLSSFECIGLSIFDGRICWR